MPTQQPQHAADQARDAVTRITESALEGQVLGNTVQAWIIAGATLALLVLIILVLRGVLASRLARIASRTRLKWDDAVVEALRGLRLWLLFPALLYAAAGTLALPLALHKALAIAAMLGVAVQLMLSARIFVDAGLETVLSRSRAPDGRPDPTLASSVTVLRVVVLFALFVVVLLVGLDNLGFKITPLLTGLGIGGIAIALAIQSVLSDLFGSLTILLDKPFVVGDSIVVGDKSGTVERIGLKTTRLRATSGEQLVFANTDLLGSRVQNFKRMQERRAVFTLGVVYETPPDKLRAVPAMIREAIEARNTDPDKAAVGSGGADGAGTVGGVGVRFDRAHLRTLGAYSLDFEAVYFVLSPDYNAYMDLQQAINLAIIERFAREGIEFAYPTQVAIQRVSAPQG
jgi:small-conductance mechanosensitive channel